MRFFVFFMPVAPLFYFMNKTYNFIMKNFANEISNPVIHDNLNVLNRHQPANKIAAILIPT